MLSGDAARWALDAASSPGSSSRRHGGDCSLVEIAIARPLASRGCCQWGGVTRRTTCDGATAPWCSERSVGVAIRGSRACMVRRNVPRVARRRPESNERSSTKTGESFRAVRSLGLGNAGLRVCISNRVAPGLRSSNTRPSPGRLCGRRCAKGRRKVSGVPERAASRSGRRVASLAVTKAQMTNRI